LGALTLLGLALLAILRALLVLPLLTLLLARRRLSLRALLLLALPLPLLVRSLAARSRRLALSGILSGPVLIARSLIGLCIAAWLGSSGLRPFGLCASVSFLARLSYLARRRQGAGQECCGRHHQELCFHRECSSEGRPHHCPLGSKTIENLDLFRTLGQALRERQALREQSRMSVRSVCLSR
jgi:hypothetical protein